MSARIQPKPLFGFAEIRTQEPGFAEIRSLSRGAGWGEATVPSIFRPAGDPLRKRSRASALLLGSGLSAAIVNLTWLGFLALPPLLILLGLLTRYQLTTPLLSLALTARRWDWSLLLDYLNLAALYVSFTVVTEITACKPPRALMHKRDARRSIALEYAAVVTWAIPSTLWAFHVTSFLTSASMGALLGLGLISTVALAHAVQRGARLPEWLAGLALTVVFVLGLYSYSQAQPLTASPSFLPSHPITTGVKSGSLRTSDVVAGAKVHKEVTSQNVPSVR